MINLHTGLPGHGKTLFTLYYVKDLADREKRTVYYSGIADLKLPWIELVDPTKWAECPPGSIIVIDECQRLFRPRSFGSQVPGYVAALETHRHGGLDLFLITQHPMLVDSNVRRLVDRHRHVVRTFGMQRCTVHEFSEIRENPTKQRDGSVRHEVAYPKEVFGWYKSAEVHTVKRRIPPRVWFLLATPVVLAALVWGAYQSLARYADPERLRESQGVASAVGAPNAPNGSVPSARALSPAAQLDQWFAARTPRVESLSFTAPIYDELTKPVEVPAPVACMATAKRCECYSQQGVRMRVEVSVCRQIVENGMHLDWRQAYPVQGGRVVTAVQELPEG